MASRVHRVIGDRFMTAVDRLYRDGLFAAIISAVSIARHQLVRLHSADLPAQLRCLAASDSLRAVTAGSWRGRTDRCISLIVETANWIDRHWTSVRPKRAVFARADIGRQHQLEAPPTQSHSPRRKGSACNRPFFNNRG